MYRETDENGQITMDFRLDSEKNLQNNIETMIEFAEKVRKDTDGESRMIRSKQEGYGYLAQLYSDVTINMKAVKTGMDKLLLILNTDETMCADQAASIFNYCQDVVEKALLMAAEAKKVSNDLYSMVVVEPLPMEEIMEDDGFEEVEEQPAEQLEEQEEQADEVDEALDNLRYAITKHFDDAE